MKKVSLIGAGGHARSVMATLEENQIQIDGIFDVSPKKNELIFNTPVFPLDQITSKHALVLAVGDNKTREDFFLQFQSQILKENIFHPDSRVERHLNLGRSNLIFAKAYLNSGIQLGDNNIINTAAILEHEVMVGSHCHISVGSILLGRCQIGDHCFIGAGAVIRDGVRIGDHVTIGANSYVSKDILSPGVHVGSPVRPLI